MKRRKGFTLVELVIVIAVIVILAAVLIPTFSGVIEKANNAKDFSYVTNMNEILELEEITNEKNETMYDAAEDLEKYGMDIEKLPSSKGYIYVWNSKENRVAVLDKDYKLVFPQGEEINDSNKENYFAVAKTEEEINNLYSLGYSVYLKESATVTTVNATQGFDAGNNTTAISVSYTNSGTQAKDVVIRTNSYDTVLTINAPLDTVIHYGEADSVNIVAVASASYHENGTVPFIQISKGRIELETTADVNGIHVANVQTVDTNGNITKTENTFSNDVVLTLNGKEVKLTRDTIGTEIATPVLVCEVQANANSDEYIWLVGDGTIENAKVYVTETKTTPDTTVASTTTIENASMAAIAIANNITNTGTEEAPVYVVVEAGTSAENAQVASALKGSGTEEDPFLVYDYETMQKITDFFNFGCYYYKVDISKTNNGTIDCTNWQSLKLNGYFDGSGVKLVNLDNNLFYYVKGNNKSSTLSNFDVEVSSSHIYSTHDAPIVLYTYSSITFNNVNVSGTAIGYAIASYIGQIYSDNTLAYTFNNCTSSLNICGYGEYAAGFIGYSNLGASYNGNGPIALELNESYFIGTLMSKANYYYSFGNNTGWFTTFSDNSANKDQYVSSTWNGDSKQQIGGTYLVQTRNLTTKRGTVNSLEVGNTLSVEASAGSTVCDILTFISPNDTNETGSYTGLYYKETVSVVDGNFTSVLTKKWNVTINGDSTTSTGLNGNTFNIVNDFYGHTHNGYTVYFVEYSNESRTTVTSVTAFEFGKSN